MKALLALWAGLAALHLLSARSRPFGVFNDEAYYVRLAQSVRRGAFALPGTGAPVTDPLPGFPLLIAAPVGLVEPRWEALRLLGLAAAAALIFFSRRLARRVLAPAWAEAAALLAAASPVLLRHTGLLIPDLAYAALVAAALDCFEPTARTLRLSAAAAALAALTRPHGALLALVLGAAAWHARGAAQGTRFLAFSLGPAGLWLLRNRLAAGTWTAYLERWGRQGAETVSAAPLVHARDVLATVLGEGFFSLAGAPAFLAGAALLAAAGWGAYRVLARRNDPRMFALAAYAGLTLALQASWGAVEARYALPLVPLLWIAALAALEPLAGGRPKVLWAAAALMTLPLLRPLAEAARGWDAPATIQPRTMAWLRAQTPKASALESFSCQTVALLAERETLCPPPHRHRDHWLASALMNKIDFVHVGPAMAAGYFPEDAQAAAGSLAAWARSTPYAALVFKDEEEGTAVFRLSHPDRARFLKAWKAYEAGSLILEAGRPGPIASARLGEAARLEPVLALPLALAAAFEASPRRRRELLTEAARRDPTSRSIQEELERLRRP